MRSISQLRTALVLAAIVAISACSDAPSAPVVSESAEAALARGGRRAREDSGTATFQLNPNFSLTVMLGDHTVHVPAGVICEPFTSGYGPEYWDAPCEVATRPIQMLARWYVKGDYSHVQFVPDLRFAPTTDPTKFATLSMRQARGEVSQLSNILWWSHASREWIDEGATDPSLAPWLEQNGNRVTRRIKHFSGYVIGAFCADACPPPPDLY